MNASTFLSNLTEESSSLFVRLPLLLFVVEGMVEVNGSQWNAWQENNTELVKSSLDTSEKMKNSMQVLLKERNFVEFTLRECEEWKKTVLPKSLHNKLKKLEAGLKELDILHNKLLPVVAQI